MMTGRAVFLAQPHSQTIRKLYIRLGLIPPDTKFNRRAHEYAQRAAQIANSKRYNKKAREAR